MEHGKGFSCSFPQGRGCQLLAAKGALSAGTSGWPLGPSVFAAGPCSLEELGKDG